MKELKQIVAENLIALRKSHNLTQSELATRLGYSDKSVSKWERGDALPDVEVLFALAKMYGVTLDYLTREGTPAEKKALLDPDDRARSHKISITVISTLLVWIVAGLIFAYVKIWNHYTAWTAFVWAVPCSCIVAIVFGHAWGQRPRTLFCLVSLLGWSLIAAVYLQCLTYNIWPLFLLGVPFQVVIVLWVQISRSRRK